ncbi:MAG: alpha-amylase family glycosyl hydrolase, partial [Spirochaetes bacterium]|nr:alpha-amylase family glycosyl hydrolase [Spirochaetota bacterium]
MSSFELKTAITNALMDDYQQISIYFSHAISENIAKKITFFSGPCVADYEIIAISDNCLIIKTSLLDIKKNYYIGYGREKKEVIPHGILDLPDFRYPHSDLGINYSQTKTVFKVFAPTASRIVVNIFPQLHTNEKKTFELIEEKYGIWSVAILQDLKGKFYNFQVDGSSSLFDFEKQVLDPYAPCVIGKTKKAMIIDQTEYIPPPPLEKPFPHDEAVIYEIHLRDISIDSSSGSHHPGKYLALVEDNTYLNHDPATKIPTLVEHFKELGINTLQIMPIQDFDNNESQTEDYHWGYMPRFFNTPDGIYSSNWENSSKISEVQRMITHLHQQGFRVILDVVYNHTAEGFWGEGVYSFNAFVPYYYYRFGKGHISNGSGCGNEFRTEGFMARKFLIDSLKHWLTYYGFDGFRFDLMGLIDLQTMTEIVEELRKIKKDVFIYGEPWTGGITPIQPTYKGMQKDKGFAVFNDDFRDALKGSVGNHKEKGFVQTSGHYHYEKVIQGIVGSINTFTSSPLESLNYVEIHDNHTLFDKLYFSITENEHFETPEGELLEKIIKFHKLCAFICLTSQGIPVLHLGQDFLRTKEGVENSYNSGDRINQIDW